MKTARNFVLAGFLCFTGAIASANSIRNIPITGTVKYGYSMFSGDFLIQGPGLSLFQATLDGSSTIGVCTVGTTCSLSFDVANVGSFCLYCNFLSSGSLGNKVAEYLDVSNFTFSGSAYYPGGDSLAMRMTFSGIITGYELINCNGGGYCSLGPQEFSVHVSGHGIGQLTLFENQVRGVTVNISGTAIATPEPMSLVLTGTGIVAMCIRRKIARARKV